jgi:hypothetical protein
MVLASSSIISASLINVVDPFDMRYQLANRIGF